MPKKICSNPKCNKEFEPSKYNPKAIYCSQSCQRSIYMSNYNKVGARRRSALPKEPCPLCGNDTNKWVRFEDKRICYTCSLKVKSGSTIQSGLYSSDGGRFYGKAWWIGKKLGKMEVVDIPFEPLCYGKHTDTEITLKCPFGHVFKKPVNRVTAVCPECLKINEDRKAAFMNVKFPYDDSFDGWKQFFAKHTGCTLIDSPENRWRNNQHFKVKARCWCGREFEPYWNDIKNKRITSCGCLYSSSQPNEEIFQLLMEYGVYAIQEYPLEGRFIDVYVPGVGLAIEFNGLRWHEERQDLEKYNMCTRNGMRYLGIYEDEWKHNKEKCKYLILENLGVNGVSEIDYAKISYSHMVDTAKAQELIDKNSYTRFDVLGVNYPLGVGPLNIGAYYNNNLIGVMSFRLEFGKPDELIGVCVDHFYKINVDSLCRLMWDWGREFTSLAKFGAIATIDDRLYGQRVVEALGFEKVGKTDPKKYWVKRDVRLSEEPKENLDQYKIIYDCGCSIWKYTPPTINQVKDNVLESLLEGI